MAPYIKIGEMENLQPKIFYPSSFRFDGEAKSFMEKQKLKSSAPPNRLYKNAKGILLSEKEKNKLKTRKLIKEKTFHW